jgi:hypothetical protein
VVCESCGFESFWHAVPDISEFRDEDEKRRYRAVFRWAGGKPSVADLVALRELSPSLAQVPIAELGRQVREQHELVVLEDFIGPVRNLQEKAHERGLAVELIPLDGPA